MPFFLLCFQFSLFSAIFVPARYLEDGKNIQFHEIQAAVTFARVVRFRYFVFGYAERHKVGNGNSARIRSRYPAWYDLRTAPSPSDVRCASSRLSGTACCRRVLGGSWAAGRNGIFFHRWREGRVQQATSVLKRAAYSRKTIPGEIQGLFYYVVPVHARLRVCIKKERHRFPWCLSSQSRFVRFDSRTFRNQSEVIMSNNLLVRLLFSVREATIVFLISLTIVFSCFDRFSDSRSPIGFVLHGRKYSAKRLYYANFLIYFLENLI